MDVIKSSRFWLALAAMIAVAVFTTVGKLDAMVGAGYLMAILAGFGVAKSGGANGVKAVLPLGLALAVASSGCGSWQATTKTSLDAASSAAETAHVALRSHFDRRCEERARECATAKLPDCPSLKTCQEERHKGVAVLTGVQTACMLGYSAIAIADKPTAMAKAVEAALAVAALIAALKTQGVLP